MSRSEEDQFQVSKNISLNNSGCLKLQYIILVRINLNNIDIQWEPQLTNTVLYRVPRGQTLAQGLLCFVCFHFPKSATTNLFVNSCNIALTVFEMGEQRYKNHTPWKEVFWLFPGSISWTPCSYILKINYEAVIEPNAPPESG